MATQTTVTKPCSWEEHYETLVNPELMTGLLRASIPVLEHCDWRVDTVGDGRCETVLPLNAASTNQHGTHQAALISLSADYTGGLALATLLRGIPLAGVHRCSDDESASLWLAGMNVKYKAPSSGHLTGVCVIDPKVAANIKERYARGSRVLVSLEIEFFSNDEPVAVAEMKYFAQPTSQLSPTDAKPSRSKLFQHKLKASARMIAGLRAQRSNRLILNPCCPHAEQAAGPHGLLLANKLEQKLPQLRDMVLARTQHIDESINACRTLRQVVMVGAGLDFRSVNHATIRPDVTFFEVDLPEMIAERRRVAGKFPDTRDQQRVQLTADFRHDRIADVLRQSPRYKEDLPTFFIYEGCSMYFSNSENQTMVRNLRGLMKHPDCRLWMDCVNQSIAERRTNNQAILSFLDGMDALGESFIFGQNDICKWLIECGFGATSAKQCGDYLNDADAVLNSYSFAIAAP